MKYSSATQTSNIVVPGSTAGGVYFGGSSNQLTQDATKLFWDNSTKRLGIGTNSPSAVLETKDNGTSATVVTRYTQDDENVFGLVIGNATYSSTILKGMGFKVANNGDAYIYANASDVSPTNALIINPSGGFLAINATTSAAAPLDVWSGLPTVLLGADTGARTRTNNTTKDAGIGVVHYTNAEEPVCLVYAQSTSTESILNFGGGSSAYNAASTLNFYTAATTTTTSGSNRLSITSTGNISVVSGKLLFDATQQSAGSPGDATINKPSGSVVIAAAASSMTLTNSFIAANSLVFGTVTSNDTTAYLKNITVSSGQAIFTLGAAATAACRIAFVVFNT